MVGICVRFFNIKRLYYILYNGHERIDKQRGNNKWEKDDICKKGNTKHKEDGRYRGINRYRKFCSYLSQISLLVQTNSALLYDLIYTYNNQ